MFHIQAVMFLREQPTNLVKAQNQREWGLLVGPESEELIIDKHGKVVPEVWNYWPMPSELSVNCEFLSRE